MATVCDPRITLHCFVIGSTTKLLVAGVLPDVVKNMGDCQCLRIPFRDNGFVWRNCSKPRLELTSHIANACKVSDLEFFTHHPPFVPSFVSFSFTHHKQVYIFHLFILFNCEFLRVVSAMRCLSKRCFTSGEGF